MKSDFAASARQAALYAGAMFLGYAVGIALVFFRLAAVSRLLAAVESGAPGIDQLHPLLGDFRNSADWLSVYRFPEHLVLDGGPWLITLVVLWVCSFAGFSVARRAPLRMAPGSLDDAPAGAITAIRIAWKDVLARAAVVLTSGIGLLLAAAVGLAGAILAETYNVIGVAVHAISAVPWTPRRPFAGLIALEDAVWLLLWTVIVPIVAIVLRARSMLRRDGAFLARWCLQCGYPKPAATDDPDGARRKCPECGSVQAALPPHASRAWLIVIAAAGVVLAAVGFHGYAPRFPAAIDRIMGASSVHANVAIVPVNSVIMVERPQETLWLQVDASVFPAVMKVIIQPSTGTGIVTKSLALPSGTMPAAPETIVLPGNQSLQLTLDWQAEFGRAHAYLVPGGAISIRPVDPSTMPGAR